MPNFERNLRQTLTYWAPASADLFSKMTYATPVSLLCRWEDKVELIRDKNGQEVSAKSKIFLATNLDLDGYVYLGTSVATDPLTLDQAFEIRQIQRLPDLRNLKTLYVVFI